jgi:hypothetical protein
VKGEAKSVRGAPARSDKVEIVGTENIGPGDLGHLGGDTEKGISRGAREKATSGHGVSKRMLKIFGTPETIGTN